MCFNNKLFNSLQSYTFWLIFSGTPWSVWSWGVSNCWMIFPTFPPIVLISFPIYNIYSCSITLLNHNIYPLPNQYKNKVINDNLDWKQSKLLSSWFFIFSTFRFTFFIACLWFSIILLWSLFSRLCLLFLFLLWILFTFWLGFRFNFWLGLLWFWLSLSFFRFHFGLDLFRTLLFRSCLFNWFLLGFLLFVGAFFFVGTFFVAWFITGAGCSFTLSTFLTFAFLFGWFHCIFGYFGIFYSLFNFCGNRGRLDFVLRLSGRNYGLW